MKKLLAFLDRLDVGRIHYTLAHFRDSITVEIAVPAEKWEVEFFADGRVEVEVFRSQHGVEDESALARLERHFP